MRLLFAFYFTINSSAYARSTITIQPKSNLEYIRDWKFYGIDMVEGSGTLCTEIVVDDINGACF